MNWVTIWGNAQSTVLPHPAYYAKDITLRYPIFIPFNGNKMLETFLYRSMKGSVIYMSATIPENIKCKNTYYLNKRYQFFSWYLFFVLRDLKYNYRIFYSLKPLSDLDLFQTYNHSRIYVLSYK